MFTEFASVQLTREELQEIQQALILRALVQDRLREEKGEDAGPDRSSLLEQIESVLGEAEEKLHAHDQKLADELWEFSWYTFTEEWAWFRAKQELQRELGDAYTRLDAQASEKLTELRYQKNFDLYTKEIEMQEEARESRKKKQPRTAS